MKKSIKSKITDLRKNAEELLSKRSLRTAGPIHSEVETMRLMHELEVHQIELEMQNQELMLAKEQAEESSKRYIELYDFAPTGYFTLSQEGRIVELNLSGAAMLGKERQVLKTTSFHLFVSEYSKPIFNLFLSKVFNRQFIKSCEVTLSTYENSSKYVYLTGLLNESGEHCLVNMVDITDRKNAEERLKKISDQLVMADREIALQNHEKEMQATELKTKNSELVQFAFLDQEVRQFAYFASQELQQPVSTISNNIQKLQEEHGKLSDVNEVKYLHAAKNAATRLTMLINSLLNFSRLGLNRKLVYCNCRQLLDNLIADLQPIFSASNTVIEVGDMPELNLYETEIRQLFRNLILNAIRLRKKDFRLWIKINSEKRDEEYRFSVSDNGTEIDSDHFEKISDIFHYLQNNEESEASGIGLVYCKIIAHLHKGEIWVESNTDHGSTFYFTIPNPAL